MVYCAGKLIENLKLFYKSDTRKALNHSPSARDLQAFLVFSQHPRGLSRR